MRTLANLSAAGVLVACLSACSPPTPTAPNLCDTERIAAEHIGEAPTSPASSAPPTTPTPSSAEQRLARATRAAMDKATSVGVAQDYWDCRVMEAEARYQVDALHRRGLAFAWHHTASVLIFGIVISTVCLGFLFAGLQFRRSLVVPVSSGPLPRPRAKDEPAPAIVAKPSTPGDSDSAPLDDEPASKPDHELELSLQAIRVRSSALGLVIWVVSIAFFYLYLAHVYPLYKGIAEERPASVEPVGE